MTDPHVNPKKAPTEFLLGLLSQQSERDKQVKIGPSEIGSPCTYCVAKRLWYVHAGITPDAKRNHWWLGAVLGTAIHAFLEDRLSSTEGAIIEQKNVIGELDEYGLVKGSTDLYIDGLVWDHKTTTKKKLSTYKQVFEMMADGEDPSESRTLAEAHFTVVKYIGQAHLYGKGWRDLGYEVTDVALGFVCRDGLTDADVWAKVIPYDPEYTERVWSRLEAIWSAVREGAELDTFASHPYCRTCQLEGRS